MIKVKICGITNLEDAHHAVKSGTDLIGFVFARSPRRISPQQALKIASILPKKIKKVGVFVNEKQSRVKNIIKKIGLDFVQFHGDETPAYCREFKKVKVIKAFRIKNKQSLDDMKKYNVYAYLLDAFVKGKRGGTGKRFNWNLAKKAKKLNKRIIISGGLNPSNVKRAIKIKPWGVDASSGIEKRPGKKDAKLIKQFILNAKGA